MKHIAFDGWLAPNAWSFIGLMVYFLDGSELRCILLDFIPIDTAHTGEAIAEKVFEVLAWFGLELTVSLLVKVSVNQVLTFML